MGSVSGGYLKFFALTQPINVFKNAKVRKKRVYLYFIRITINVIIFVEIEISEDDESVFEKIDLENEKIR